MKFTSIFSQQALCVQTKAGNKLPIPLGRSTIPAELVGELQRYVDNGVIQLNSRFGDRPHEAESKKIAETQRAREVEAARGIHGPDLARARPITNVKGEADDGGRWEVVSSKTFQRIKTFDTPEEAEVFAQEQSEQAWQKWMQGAAPEVRS